ncbi:MAG: phosphate acyltransferase PlsX [Phycisphaerales bacterium]
MRLAIDVMGGDHAPDAILKGVFASLSHLAPDDRLVLVGPEDIIRDTMREHRIDDARLEIHHAPEVIAMDETPVTAVKSKPDSSIVRMAMLGSPAKAAKLGAEPVDAVISAGNTGACVSAATMYMRRLAGAHRPGIAVAIPSFSGPLILCDGGANPEPRPLHLAQYGVMAEAMARLVHHIERPRVALLNIGSEEAKGTELIKEVRTLLRAVPDMNYIGYIEGREILEGTADVVIADGFVGNTTLKLTEGVAMSVVKAIFQAIFEADPDLALQMDSVAKSLSKRLDYHEFGGAPLLGVNGVCVICHGSSKPQTIAAAIRNTREQIISHLNDEIVRRLEICNDVWSRMGSGDEPVAAAGREPS